MCKDCGKKVGKVRGHYSKYCYDVPNGFEEYKPDDMDDWCTCLCVDGATMEQRKVITALKAELVEAEGLLERANRWVRFDLKADKLGNAIQDFLNKREEADHAKS